jgi:protein-export membrane protein SecD
MENKKRFYLIITIILFLAFFSADFSYPKYFNRGADLLNSKLKIQDSKFKIPHFPNIPFKLGLDLQGGSHLLYEADLSQIDPKNYKEAMAGLRDVIERRVNLFGVSEPVVQVEEKGNSHRLIVELAGIKDIGEAIKAIGQTPYLEFKEERTQEETQRIIDKQKEVQGKSPEEIQKIPDWQIAFEDPYFKSTQLTGRFLKKAEVNFDSTTGKPLISLQFNDDGAKIFEELTAKNVGKRLAIYLDQTPISAPVVQEKISGGKAQITGNFTINSARDLVRNLNAGALPVPIKLISQQTVGPILGKVSLEQSLKAGIIGFVAVICFMIIFYRLPGILASLALLIYLSLVLSAFKIFSVTLTLAGIAGFILSIGMAVDANILIFSRMREERKRGANFLASVEDGVKRAWPSIRDSNSNTLIVSVILFAFGASFVKGFAFTLIVGVLVSMFSAIFITNNFLRIFVGTKLEKWGWIW